MEIHSVLPDYGKSDYEFYKFFENNTWDKILGLSGSIALSKYYYLNRIAPIVASISTQEAVDLGLVSPFIIYNIPIKISEEEQKEYSSLSKDILASSLRGRRSWKKIGNRKKLVTTTDSKLKAIKQIVDLLQDEKGLIFSLEIDYTDKVTKAIGDTCVSYHSKISKKRRESILLDFSNNKYNQISTPKALNEGANIPYLTYAIIAAGTSKERDVIQRLGRVIRFEENKNAKLIRLYHSNTVDEKWMKDGQKKYTPIYLNSIEEFESIIKKEKNDIGN